jgi:hypothetical protein
LNIVAIQRQPTAQEFKKAELAFRRFVNKDIRYRVTAVDLVINPVLEVCTRA